MFTRLAPLIVLWFFVASLASAEMTPAGDAKARRLINAQGCKACHSLEGAGGTRAASLEAIAAKRAPERVRLYLAGSSGRHGDSRIPDFSHLPDDDLDALALFIKNLAGAGEK